LPPRLYRVYTAIVSLTTTATTALVSSTAPRRRASPRRATRYRLGHHDEGRSLNQAVRLRYENACNVRCTGYRHGCIHHGSLLTTTATTATTALVSSTTPRRRAGAAVRRCAAQHTVQAWPPRGRSLNQAIRLKYENACKVRCTGYRHGCIHHGRIAHHHRHHRRHHRVASLNRAAACAGAQCATQLTDSLGHHHRKRFD
jgi:hypothetical protein